MSFTIDALGHTISLAKQYALTRYVCSCERFHSCEILNVQVLQFSHDWVLVKGDVRQSGAIIRDDFGGKMLRSLRCPHDIDKHVQVRISSDQLELVASKSSRFIAMRAVWNDGILDATSSPSGALASFEARPDEGDDSPVSACELFSGGYSGWTQGMRRLSQLGFKIDRRIAVDIDECCCET